MCGQALGVHRTGKFDEMAKKKAVSYSVAAKGGQYNGKGGTTPIKV